MNDYGRFTSFEDTPHQAAHDIAGPDRLLGVKRLSGVEGAEAMPPVPLGSIGMPSCSSFLTGQIASCVVDPGANPMGATVTNGVRGVVGFQARSSPLSGGLVATGTLRRSSSQCARRALVRQLITFRMIALVTFRDPGVSSITPCTVTIPGPLKPFGTERV
jgi:hypothetical protein